MKKEKFTLVVALLLSMGCIRDMDFQALSILDGCVIFTFFVVCLVGGYAYMKGRLDD